MQFNIVGTDRTYRCWIIYIYKGITKNSAAFKWSYTIPIAYTSTSTYAVVYTPDASNSMHFTCIKISNSVIQCSGNYNGKYTVYWDNIIAFGY